jgi:succinoglycan biosynthesis protein ExoM
MTTLPPDTVSVCIATFRRPQGLARVLRGVSRLTFQKVPRPDAEVLVVDNDPDGSARAVCEELRGEVPWPLRYVSEPRRGLSHVRNRAVERARERSRLIAFIDDDEEPVPEWLDELLDAQRRFDADVVLGPALRRFEGEVPEWIRRGRFFEDTRYPTGTAVEHGGIGNALIHSRVLPESEPPFDERLALSGGEDTLFFLRLAREGRRMVWSDEAVIHEWIPPTRARAGWILQRVYRWANTWSLCERELRPGLRVALTRLGKGVARIGFGLAMLPVAWLGGRHRLVRSLWHVCYGAGNLTGLAGRRYDEYRVTHGQ